MNEPRDTAPALTPFDLYLLAEGRHYRSVDKLGAHPCEIDGVAGVRFAVWAPNAERVEVIGDFNGWQPGVTPLRVRTESGVWEGFVPTAPVGALYKYRVASRWNEYVSDRADPYDFAAEIRPHDVLEYASQDPIHRSYHHGRPWRVPLALPPLGVVVLRCREGERP